MCLAIPAKIEAVENNIATCRVGEGETFIKASLLLVDPVPQCGDFIIVHAGFALRKLEPEEAEESLCILREMAKLAGNEGVNGTF